jgi:uncharacterized protein (UPF0261 family)
MVSTVAAGDVSAFVGTSDIIMMHSVVDVAGINRISRPIYLNAAAAIAAMTMIEIDPAPDDKPLIGISMFGNTTRAVNQARAPLEAAGYEVLVFHATGTGGRTLEALARAGQLAGVLDMTTTEWADELLGGVLSAGPERLTAAGAAGLPQVIVPGCIDMCNFWAPETVPARYIGRLFYHWNANITLMRTTPDENAQLGAIFARQLNAARGPVAVYVPLGGVSELDIPGGPFHDPAALPAFLVALKRDLRADIPVHEAEMDINDPRFAALTADALLDMLKGKP